MKFSKSAASFFVISIVATIILTIGFQVYPGSGESLSSDQTEKTDANG
jgi:hypothetical protein